MSKIIKTKFQFRILSGQLRSEHTIEYTDVSLFKAIEKIQKFYFRAEIINCYNANFTPPLLLPEVANIVLYGNMAVIKQLIENSKKIAFKRKRSK